jgi:dTDP-L-rhamnose 4-epimerase
MSKKILVTGGAGFIGSFIVDELVKQGHDVRVLDNIDPQVHSNRTPDFLNKNVEFIKGDITNKGTFKNALQDVEVVFHQASAVGVGQSMYQVEHYTKVNSLGTAVLLDLLVNTEHNVKKLLVAASMSSYGEGSYECENCGLVEPELRTEEQMKKRDWEIHCPKCNRTVKPVPTKETKTQKANSIYAITKKNQEEMCLNIGKAYGIPIVALRYFNVYGPRQSLSNPYTGVVAIFMSRIKNNHSPVVYEDGLQTRDFISVHDVVRANILAMKSNNANYEVFNVGTCKPLTIKSVAGTLAKLYRKDIRPDITNKFRKGDVRHCFADITKIKNKVGFEPKMGFEEGMKELVEWSKTTKAEDKFEKATEELREKGLI